MPGIDICVEFGSDLTRFLKLLPSSIILANMLRKKCYGFVVETAETYGDHPTWAQCLEEANDTET
eukprot:7385832-Ditylum_brightwellii.AAC.1